MSPTLDFLAMHLARVLLRLHPSSFRTAWGGEVEALVRDLVGDAFAAGGTRAALRVLGGQGADLLATAVRLRAATFRLPAPGVLRPAGAAVAVLLLALLARDALPLRDALHGRDAAQYEQLVVDARDPAGAFTLTLRGGRLVAGTLDAVPVPPERLEQRGNRLRIFAEDGTVALVADFEPPGVLRWEARR